MRVPSNGILPAHPQEWTAHIEGAPAGLTKREYFSGIIMASVLAPSNTSRYCDPTRAAHFAVAAANALLDELEKGAR